jgi:hypothetical protein
VSRALPEAIVEFLRFSGTMSDHPDKLEGFGRREWARALIWLDDAGLALYFLQKIEYTNATEIVPTEVLSRLKRSLAANQRRVAHMTQQFSSLNQRFDAASARYLVVKGFSLVPQFCPDASLRHQSDFDYLVDDESLSVAQRILEQAGYSLKTHSTHEFTFVMPSARVPVLDEQYEAHAPFAVELHLGFWHADFQNTCLAAPRFSFDLARIHEWQGLTFQTLREEDAFLLQAVHAFRHTLEGWVRMSWLYEIGYFLNRRATDSSLWGRIERRVGGDCQLREMVVVIAELVAQFFRAPLPSTLRIWAKDLRPAVRIWIQNYARTWIFGGNRVDQFSLFPSAKLVLFLHQQYASDTGARRQLIWAHLLPSTRLSRIARSIRSQPSTIISARWGRHERVGRRLLFHVTGGLRYFLEIPRWRWLNRASTHLPPSTMRDASATELVSTRSSGSNIQM